MVRICIYIYISICIYFHFRNSEVGQAGSTQKQRSRPPLSAQSIDFFFRCCNLIATSSGNWTYLTYRSSETRWLPRKIPIMNGCCCCLTDLMTMDICVSQLLIHRDRIKSTSMNTSGVHSIQFKNQPTSWDVNKVRFFLKWRFKLPIWYLGSDNANANFDWLTLTCGLFGLVYNIITPVLR